MPLEDQYEWFGYTHKKFLHNIDTFYYSVKFRNDFRLKSKDPQVEKMRKFFKLQYSYLNGMKTSRSYICRNSERISI